MLTTKIKNTNIILKLSGVDHIEELLESELSCYKLFAVGYSNLAVQLAFSEIQKKFSDKAMVEYFALRESGHDLEENPIHIALYKKLNSKSFQDKYGPVIRAQLDNSLAIFASGILATQGGYVTISPDHLALTKSKFNA